MLKLILIIISAGMVCAEYKPYVEASRPWKSITRYVEVRPGAFLFYWFYYADGKPENAEKKPFIIWVQGGPGLAASGLANFAEIGPLNMYLEPRNHTWVNGRNLLLIDHPVGTGFSYVHNESLLVKTDKELVLDLKAAIKSFFKEHQQFVKTPVYIFGQSYGGKICPRLAYSLLQSMRKKRIKMNLKGIGMGSSWTNPRESVLSQPEYLYHTGLIDRSTYLNSRQIAKNVSKLIDAKRFMEASVKVIQLYYSFGLDQAMYDILNNINQESPYPKLVALTEVVNKYVKPTLWPTVDKKYNWNYLSDEVFFALSPVSTEPTKKFLEHLLNHTSLRIAVYNGNLDAVTPLSGASNWVHKLKWHGAEEFKNAKRVRIRGYKNGFYKTSKKFSFWSVFGAGHWVPEDNPTAMEQILEYVLQDKK